MKRGFIKRSEETMRRYRDKRGEWERMIGEKKEDERKLRERGGGDPNDRS